MKILLAALFTTQVLFTTTIYNFTVPKIEGGNQALSAYQGKKILVITLPIVKNASADSLLYKIDTLASAHTANLKVIAVPAFEDGFTSAQKNNLKQWYRTKLSNQILITDGLYTHKSSGIQQHALFKWLTNASQNEVFDIDASGPGFKFFANAVGELYYVMHPQTKISGTSVQKALQAP
jgi:glutathione peroxidase-family protein